MGGGCAEGAQTRQLFVSRGRLYRTWTVDDVPVHVKGTRTVPSQHKPGGPHTRAGARGGVGVLGQPGPVLLPGPRDTVARGTRPPVLQPEPRPWPQGGEEEAEIHGVPCAARESRWGESAGFS